ncbi:hypothetical protein ABEB36_014508 [Hypothenemus hampei]|uniref:THAP-type domain-containing protein n=1 Tax=Hypothenemus hampei TaxID=57062 RepID=A0ABD1E202_HYPHA
MPGTRCYVPECNSMGNINKITMRNLPFFDPEVMAIWKSRIGNPSIDSCNDIKIDRNRYRVCDRHFDKWCILVGEKRLCRDSLPTLNLLNYFGESTEITSRYHLFQNLKCQTISANINFLHEENETTQLNLLPGPSTSNIDDHLMQEVLTKPATPPRNILQKLKIRKKVELSPKTRLLYDEVNKLRKVCSRLRRNRKNKRSVKDDLHLANELIMNPCFDRVNSLTRQFMMSQITQQYKAIFF